MLNPKKENLGNPICCECKDWNKIQTEYREMEPNTSKYRFMHEDNVILPFEMN
jgi:hypothetical protein